MLEALVGGVIVLIGWVANEFIKSGSHKKEHEIIADKLERHDARLERSEERHDKQDVLNATLITELKYISAGIDELRGRAKDD